MLRCQFEQLLLMYLKLSDPFCAKILASTCMNVYMSTLYSASLGQLQRMCWRMLPVDANDCCDGSDLFIMF